VKIYDRKPPEFPYFRLAYYTGGKRVMATFADLEEARREAKAKAEQLARGDVDAAMMKGTDRLIYGRALDAIKDFGVTLDAAAQEYAASRRLAPAVSLVEVARFYHKHHNETVVPKTVGETVEALLHAKQKQGLSEKYQKDLRTRCGAFADSFPGMRLGELTREPVEKWLESTSNCSRTFNNRLATLNTLFEFARKRRLLPKDVDPLEGIERRKDTGGQIGILSPRELTLLLSSSPSDLLPLLVLGAFCGIRTAELLRLTWQDVRLAEKLVEITPERAKTASRRLIPLNENAVLWLTPYAALQGLIWTSTDNQFHKAIRRLAKRVKVSWKQNALRHSFISYRVAETQNVNQTALQAGTSPAMVFRNYREVVQPSEAEKWFSCRPQPAGKVIRFGHGERSAHQGFEARS